MLQLHSFEPILTQITRNVTSSIFSAKFRPAVLAPLLRLSERLSRIHSCEDRDTHAHTPQITPYPDPLVWRRYPGVAVQVLQDTVAELLIKPRCSLYFFAS